MKHKLIGKLWNKEPNKKIWYDMVRTSSDTVELGDSLILTDYQSENMDELIVRPSIGTCNSGCWAYGHLESPVCRSLLNCSNTRPRVCLVHIGEVLEDL